MSARVTTPAFYASRRGAFGDWWTILHPPYTAWHLSYVVIGAALAAHTDGVRLAATLLAFFAAVGVAAHALDELHGRPLQTHVHDRVLVAASVAGLVIAVGLGIAGIARVGIILLPFIVVGPMLVAGYNLEWCGGRFHTDLAFAASWGGFALLVGYVAQVGTLGLSALIGAVAATAFALAQRSLSTPARALRRKVVRVDGSIVFDDRTSTVLDVPTLLAPLERSLRALAFGMTTIAVALAIARLA